MLPFRTDLSQAQQLVGLQAQPPARPRQAAGGGEAGVALKVRSVHRLQEEVRKVEVLERFRLGQVCQSSQA